MWREEASVASEARLPAVVVGDLVGGEQRHQRLQVLHLVGHKANDSLVAAHLAQRVHDAASVRQQRSAGLANRHQAHRVEQRRDHILERAVDHAGLLLVFVEYSRHALRRSSVLGAVVRETRDQSDHLCTRQRYVGHAPGRGTRGAGGAPLPPL